MLHKGNYVFEPHPAVCLSVWRKGGAAQPPPALTHCKRKKVGAKTEKDSVIIGARTKESGEGGEEEDPGC